MKKKDTVVVFVWKVSIRRRKRHKFNMDEEECLFTEVNVMDLVKVSEEETLLKSTVRTAHAQEHVLLDSVVSNFYQL